MGLQEIKTKLTAFLTKRNIALGLAAVGIFALGFLTSKIGSHHGHERRWSERGRHGMIHHARMDRSGKGIRGGDPAKRIEHRVEKMKSELGLSETQAAQIAQILKDNASEMKAQFEVRKQAMKSDSAQRKLTEAEMQQFKARREALDQKIAAVLTVDQRTKYDQMKEKRRDGRGRRDRG